MQKLIFPIILGVFSFVSVIPWIPAFAGMPGISTTGTVLNIEGKKATLKRQEKTQILKEKQKVVRKDTVQTGLKTRAELLFPFTEDKKTYVTVYPESSFTVQNTYFKNQKPWHVRLASGLLKVFVDPGAGSPSFKVETSQAVIGVRGTEFYLCENQIGRLLNPAKKSATEFTFMRPVLTPRNLTFGVCLLKGKISILNKTTKETFILNKKQCRFYDKQGEGHSFGFDPRFFRTALEESEDETCIGCPPPGGENPVLDGKPLPKEETPKTPPQDPLRDGLPQPPPPPPPPLN